MAAPQKGLKTLQIFFGGSLGIYQAPCNRVGQNSDFVVFWYTLVLSQAFHTQLFCNCQERVEFFLGNIYLSMVHEVKDSLHVSELHPLEVEQRVLVWVLLQDSPEEWGAS